MEKIFVCTDLCIVEIWNISKILWCDTENSVVTVILQALNNCVAFAQHYGGYKDAKTWILSL